MFKPEDKQRGFSYRDIYISVSKTKSSRTVQKYISICHVNRRRFHTANMLHWLQFVVRLVTCFHVAFFFCCLDIERAGVNLCHSTCPHSVLYLGALIRFLPLVWLRVRWLVIHIVSFILRFNTGYQVNKYGVRIVVARWTINKRYDKLACSISKEE